MVHEGMVHEVKAGLSTRQSFSKIKEVLEVPESVLTELENIRHVYKASFTDEKLTIECSGGKHNLIRILDVLQKENISFGRVYTELPTLNDVFLEITGKALRDKED